MFCDKENRDLSSKIYCASIGGISQDFLVPLDKKKVRKAKFEITEENTKLQVAKKHPL